MFDETAQKKLCKKNEPIIDREKKLNLNNKIKPIESIPHLSKTTSVFYHVEVA